MNALFFFNSILLGAGLSVDAFAVSLADGLAERSPSARRQLAVAGTFGLFQAAMPLLGWLLVHTIAERFLAFQRYIPWVALALLLFLGVRMLLHGLREKDSPGSARPLRGGGLLLQGVATSIDALSVGFAIARYAFPPALLMAVLIGLVTFGLCLLGVSLGRRIGTRLAGRATIVGGVILILVGIEIFFLR